MSRALESGPTAPRVVFTPRELGRVGAAATMMVFGGTVIILLMMAMMGHYNSLAHSGPKAVLDGAVIALLLGKQHRWRVLPLLGIVYGLVLLIQIGVPYLPIVLTFAGILGAVGGKTAGLINRRLGILIAAGLFTWAAGLGSPIKIYFGTADQHEPFLWGLWFAEWPLRIGGAWLGVMLTWRGWAKPSPVETIEPAIDAESQPLTHGMPGSRTVVRGVRPAALRLAMLLLAAILPLVIQKWSALTAITLLTLTYALVLGSSRRVLQTLLGIVWGWAVFAAASYLWHHDPDRVIDLIRTFALRFAPMALAAVVLIGTTRPVDVLRVLRHCKIPRAVLLPMAVVLRQIPQSRRELSHGFAQLRQKGQWKGPLSLFRNPSAVLGTLLFRPLQRWAQLLSD